MADRERVICQNCERNIAIYQCQNCEKNESFFCSHCWTIHLQVKAFRAHRSSPLERPKSCANCDVKSAVVQCQNCIGDDSYYCKSCSDIHIQIKTNRSHSFVPLGTSSAVSTVKSNNRSKITNFLEKLYLNYLYLLQYLDLDSFNSPTHVFDWIPESISDLLGTEVEYKTVIFGLAIAFFVHLFVKVTFGKNSVYIVLAIGVVGVRWLKRKQTMVSKELKEIEKNNQLLFGEMKSIGSKAFLTEKIPKEEEELLRNEFWHGTNTDTNNLFASTPMGPGPSKSDALTPQFRPRGKLYQRKTEDKTSKCS